MIITPLLYNEKPMTWNPTNVGVDLLLTRLRSKRMIRVILEPGDMTRYDLVLGFEQMLFGTRSTFVAIRCSSSGDPIGTVILDATPRTLKSYEMADMSANNEWTAEFLAWWLTGLLYQL